MNTSTNQVRAIRPDIKVTDTRYGLHTAARVAYERKQRAEFNDAHRDSLVRERGKVQTKLASLRGEIRKLFAKLDTGVISDPTAVDDAMARLARLGACERKYEDDISRITSKIGAIS